MRNKMHVVGKVRRLAWRIAEIVELNRSETV